jgi:hypothetical protein
LGNMDSNQLIQLLLLNELQKGGRKGKKKQGSDSSSGSDVENQDIGLVKALKNMDRLRRGRIKRPRKITRGFRKAVLKKLNVRPGQAWSMKDHWKTLPIGRHRTIGRITYVIAEALERFELGQPDAAWATLVQLYKALHQFLLDGGSWKAAWLLTLVEDPYGEDSFGGSNSELAVVGGHLRASADLYEKVHGKSASSSTTPGLEKDPLVDEKPFKPPKGGGRGKG